jgi:LemA protein
MAALIILLVIIVVGLVFFISIYNGLVSKRNQYKNAFAQIDVQLKRRYDLIPNLVETAKGYIKHERETLEAVISARNKAYDASKAAAAAPGDPEAMKALATSESALKGTMIKMFALTESYPDLKANTTMNQLMEELTSTENRISFARQAYNDSVTDYNNTREQFPGNLMAGGFSAATLLELENPAVERQNVKVSFT